MKASSYFKIITNYLNIITNQYLYSVSRYVSCRSVPIVYLRQKYKLLIMCTLLLIVSFDAGMAT